MPSEIFNKILDNHINSFIEEFSNLPKELFIEDGKLFHPGEYGKYREKIIRNLFKTILYEDLKISEGFLINNNNGRSTQCDIVIYDYKNTPILKNDNNIFIPVETAVGIGEIKSKLSKIDFKKALRKLAKNKELKEFATGVPIKRDNRKRSFIPARDDNDQLFSFLICKKLNFNINKIDFEEIYEGIERRNRHNVILSIEDGLFNYMFRFHDMKEDSRMKLKQKGIDTNRKSNMSIPIFLETNCHHNFIAKTSKNEFIKEFLAYVHSSIHSASILNVDIRSYYRDFDRENTLFNKNI